MSKSTLVLGTLLLMTHLSTFAALDVFNQIHFNYYIKIETKKAHFSDVLVNIEDATSTPEAPKYKEAHMMLSLYSSELALATSCHKSAPTDPEEFLFDPKTNTDDSKVKTLDFGSFSVQGYDAKANSNVYKAKHWKSDKIVALPTCPPLFKSFDTLRGVMGLGYEGAAKDRFTNDKIKAFGIDFKEQIIYLNPDTNKEIRGEPRHHLKTTNANWHTVGSGKVSMNDEVVHTGDMALLFDLNIRRINFPKELYDAISAGIKKLDLKTPKELDATIQRSTDKDLSKYPKISIVIGDQNLVLEPKDYLEHAEDAVRESGIETPVDAEDQRIESLIYPVEEKYKKNVIVLGRNYMNKYYPVFDVNEGQITLHNSDEKIIAAVKAKRLEAEQGREAEETQQKEEKKAAEKARLAAEARSALLKWIALVVIILILVAVVGFFLWKKKQANKLNNELNDQYKVAV